MGKLLCEKNYGTFGVEMRAYGQKLVTFCKHTHTQTHASKLVVEINSALSSCVSSGVCSCVTSHMLLSLLVLMAIDDR